MALVPHAQPGATHATGGPGPSSRPQPLQTGAAPLPLPAPQVIPARPSAPSLADVEPELLVEIVARLAADDLGTARLACRGLDAIGRARGVTGLCLSPGNTLRCLPRRLVWLDDAGQLRVGKWETEDAKGDQGTAIFPGSGRKRRQTQQSCPPGCIWEYRAAEASGLHCPMSCGKYGGGPSEWRREPDTVWACTIRRPDWRRFPALRTITFDGWQGCQRAALAQLLELPGWQEGGGAGDDLDGALLPVSGAARGVAPRLSLPALTGLRVVGMSRPDFGHPAFWEGVIGGVLRAAPNVERLELCIRQDSRSTGRTPCLDQICAHAGRLTALRASGFDLDVGAAARLCAALPGLRDLAFAHLYERVDHLNGGLALPVERLTALECDSLELDGATSARIRWTALRTLRIMILPLDILVHLSEGAPALATLRVYAIEPPSNREAPAAARERLAAACFPALRDAHLGVAVDAGCQLAGADLARLMPAVEQLELAERVSPWGGRLHIPAGSRLRGASLSGLERLRALTLKDCGCAAGLLGLGGACCRAGAGAVAGGWHAVGGNGGAYNGGGNGGGSLGAELERASSSAVGLPRLAHLSCQLCCVHGRALGALAALSSLVLVPNGPTRNADGSLRCAACADLSAAYSQPAPPAWAMSCV